MAQKKIVYFPLFIWDLHQHTDINSKQGSVPWASAQKRLNDSGLEARGAYDLWSCWCRKKKIFEKWPNSCHPVTVWLCLRESEQEKLPGLQPVSPMQTHFRHQTPVLCAWTRRKAAAGSAIREDWVSSSPLNLSRLPGSRRTEWVHLAVGTFISNCSFTLGAWFSSRFYHLTVLNLRRHSRLNPSCIFFSLLY